MNEPMIWNGRPGIVEYRERFVGVSVEDKDWWAHPDSNQEPAGYEPDALPLSYGPF